MCNSSDYSAKYMLQNVYTYFRSRGKPLVWYTVSEHAVRDLTAVNTLDSLRSTIFYKILAQCTLARVNRKCGFYEVLLVYLM